MTTPALNDFLAILPFVLAALGGLVVVVADLVTPPEKPRKFLGGICVAVAGLIIFSSLSQMGQTPQKAFFGMVSGDDFGRFLSILFAASAGLSALLAMGRLPEKGVARGEFYALLLFSTAGACLLVQATDLVALFIGLETLSIPAYILAATLRRDARSSEAGMKYFILGAFATGFLIYGIALLYGASGSTQLEIIANVIKSNSWTESYLLIIGSLFVIIGLIFKIAVVPFHMWAPDVYQGAPTPATAFFATAVKAAAVAALIRILFIALPDMRVGPEGLERAGWFNLLQGFAILTMTVANLVALVQKDVKRMLAYSSIAHAGYLLIGILSDKQGGASVLFYLFAYLFMTVGAFALVAYFERDQAGTTLAEYRGLGRKSPLAAVALTVFLFSLAGIPPTAGFFAKFYLFKAAVSQGLVMLTVIAVLNSLVSAYYYLRVMVAMYMEPELGSTPAPSRSMAVALVVLICLFFVMAMGVYPVPYLDLAHSSIAVLP